jgi:diadenosine tetraphosphate (Ap4A) HIT family hydrolase
MRPRRLQPPVAEETPRHGHGGVECVRCVRSDDEYLWMSQRWRLWALDSPTGLPVVVLLEPREHFAEPGDLPDELAAELGVLLARIERAIRAAGEIGRVHVCRWGDGSEHLHWWFMARPARMRATCRQFRRDLGRHPPATARGRVARETSDGRRRRRRRAQLEGAFATCGLPRLSQGRHSRQGLRRRGRQRAAASASAPTLASASNQARLSEPETAAVDIPPEAPRTLGDLLHDHVRVEERELFEAIERIVPAAELEGVRLQAEAPSPLLATRSVTSSITIERTDSSSSGGNG